MRSPNGMALLGALLVLAGCSDARGRPDAALDARSGCGSDEECPATQVCFDGVCACPSGQSFCAGRCVVDSVDSCGPSCAACAGECVAGICVERCAPRSGACASGCCPWERHHAPATDAIGGEGIALALDDDGGVHVAHRGARALNDVVRYHYFDGTTWALRASASASNRNWQNGIALGPDAAHVAYSVFNRDNSKTVWLARWTAEETTFEALQGADFGTPAALVVADDGAMHLAWREFIASEGFTYSTRPSGGEWTHTRVAAPHVSWAMDLRLDTRSVPHVAYGSAGTGVFYGTQGAEGFTFEQVGGDPSTSRVSLALDAAGRPHLAFFEEESDQLFYATRADAGWTVSLVDPEPDAGFSPSLALDAADGAHIAYQHRTEGALRYARRRGDAWQVETVDPGPEAGAGCAIAVDATGRRHVVYAHVGHANLVYATLAP